MTGPRQAGAWLLLAWGLVFASPVRAERWWVELPRSPSAREAWEGEGLPEVGVRALQRRALRGRPDRVQVLARGPRADAVHTLRALGVRVRYLSRWLSAASVEADAAQLRQLRARFGVRALRPVRRLHRPRIPVAPAFRATAAADSGFYGPSLAQLAQIGVDSLQSLGAVGTGVRVLVLDTGFDRAHPAFGRLDVAAQWDFVQQDSITADEAGDPPNQDRHGTGVLGTLAAYAPGELIGPVWDATFLLAKTERLATEIRVEEDDFVAALEWGEALGADVATASLGYRDFPDEPDSFAYLPSELDGNTAVTTRAVDDLVALGVVVVNSAGNAGPDSSSLLTPADADSVLAVGAVDAAGNVTAFSSRGPTADGRIKPEVCARGLATVWAEATDGGYRAVSGTSLAAPLVAGAVTQLLQWHPEWGPGDLRSALLQTASQAAHPDNIEGWGIVDAPAAAAQTVAVHPLPFSLLAPPDSAEVLGSAVVFRWMRAVDRQSPSDIDYAIELASDRDFGSPLGRFEAGRDTVRALSFLPAGGFWWRVTATDPEGHRRLSRRRWLRAELLTATDPVPDGEGLRLRRVSDADIELRGLRPGHLELSVYDLAGRRVRSLWSGPVGAGEAFRRLRWDGRDRGGREVARGVYLLEAVVRTGSRAPMQRAVLRWIEGPGFRAP